MKSQTSLVAQQTRLNQWAEQIRECNNRPQDMTIQDWCQSQGITKASYYWRLRKVREALLTVADVTPTFIELKEPESVSCTPKVARGESSSTIAAIINKGSYSIEIMDLASASFLRNLLEAVHHA